MKRLKTGQSLTETLFLTALIATGALGLWGVCCKRIEHFIDLLLTFIASPVP